MLIHIFSVLREEDVLDEFVLIEWMNEREVFFDLSLVDDLDKFPVIEVLFGLLNIRYLALDITLGHLRIEESVLIVLSN